MCPDSLVEIPFKVKRVDNRNLRLFVWAIIKFKHPRSGKVISKEIEFQVDTGADSTSLFNRDIMRLSEIGVSYGDFRKLPEAEWSRGILGEKFTTYSLRKVTLIFQTSQGKQHTEKLDSLRVVRIPERDNNKPYACRALLGMNLLERFNVHFDGPGETAVARKTVQT